MEFNVGVTVDWETQTPAALAAAIVAKVPAMPQYGGDPVKIATVQASLTTLLTSSTPMKRVKNVTWNVTGTGATGNYARVFTTGVPDTF